MKNQEDFKSNANKNKANSNIEMTEKLEKQPHKNASNSSDNILERVLQRKHREEW